MFFKFAQNYKVVWPKRKSLDGCYDETYRLIITINSTSLAAYFIVQSIVMIIMHSNIVQSTVVLVFKNKANLI